ncbi:MAG: response regulator [Thermoanaerobaculia bacterium]|jgi:CheY-like chemotaxis protein
MPERVAILLVEDNDDDAELTSLALASPSLAYRLQRVRDGAEAFDVLSGSATRAEETLRPLPVVVLLDLRLPKVSGLELLEAIRANERTRALPVIVLSNSAWDRERLEERQLGPIAFVGKPVQRASLAAAAASLGLRLWSEA